LTERAECVPAKSPKASKRSRKGGQALACGQQPTSYDSIGAAAAALGIPPEVLKKAKRAGAPGFKGSRVYPKELLPWLEAHRANLTAPGSKEDLEKERLREDIRKRRKQNDLRDGLYLPLARACEIINGIAARQNALLGSLLEDELPPILADQPAAAIRVEMKRARDRICDLFQEMLSQVRVAAKVTAEKAAAEK
jgi:hypothetical protein